MSASRSRAALGSGLFLLVAPGVVAGLVPWWLTGWEAGATRWPLQAIGTLLIVAGVIVLVDSFIRFVVEGIGTPAPVAATQELVVSGVYRHVRNPMYLAVGATIVGQALLLGRPILLLYSAAFAVAVFAFVRGTRSRRSRGSSALDTRITVARCRAGGLGVGRGAASAALSDELPSARGKGRVRRAPAAAARSVAVGDAALRR